MSGDDDLDRRARIQAAVARRQTMAQTIVLQDNNMLANILAYLPTKSCLPFVLTCKLFYSCYKDYLRREIVSDFNYYCATASQVEWAKTLTGCPLNPASQNARYDQYGRRIFWKLILLGTLASGDVKSFMAAFHKCTGVKNPFHSVRKLVHCRFRDEMLLAAASYGRIDMIEHLRSLNIWLSPPPPAMLMAAASRGQLGVVQYLFALETPSCITSKMLYEVAKSGQLEALKLLRNKNPNCAWLPSTTVETALRGHLHVLEWMATLDSNALPTWKVEIILKVCKMSKLNHVLKFLLSLSHLVVVENCAGNAISGRNLEGLKLLRGHDPPCSLSAKTLADKAMLAESIDILEYLKEQGYFVPPERSFNRKHYYNVAARVGLPIMQWLHAQTPSCNWSPGTMSVAAECGNIEVIQWARAQDPPCPWNRQVCLNAVQHEHLDLIRWLRSGSNPCPWGVECCDQASVKGNLKMMKYLRVESVEPCPWNIDNVVFFTLESYDIDMLKWLRTQDLGNDAPITRTVKNLLNSRQQYDIRTQKYSMKGKFKKMVQYLSTEELLPAPWNNSSFTNILFAVHSSPSEFVKWVQDYVPELDEKLSHWMYFW